MVTLRTINLNDPNAGFRNCALALAALAALTVAAFLPTDASAGRYHIDDPDDLVEELINMDANDIADLRDDLIDARADIREAIEEVADAKEDVKEAPGGEAISRVAFRVASAAVSRATGAALAEARDTLDDAELILAERRSDIGDAEFAETQGAIDMIRTELGEIESVLDELLAALRES